MEKRVPKWSEIPLHFKMDVIKELGYKDRCSLRKCSTKDMYSVDATPNQLHDVAINTYETYSLLSFADQRDIVYTVKYFKNLGETDAKIEFYSSPRVFLPGKNQKIISKTIKTMGNLPADSDDLDLVLIDFQILMNKLNCEKLYINGVSVKDSHPMAHPNRTMEYRIRLWQLFLDPEVPKIKTKSLSLHWHQEQDEICDILRKIDHRTLESLEFLDRNATWQMDQIIRTEQWRGAQKLYLEVLTNMNVRDYSHFSDVQMHVRDLPEHDLWRVIQNFIFKNQHGSSFYFNYRQAEPDLQRILATFNVEPKDEPFQARTQLRSILGGRFIHTQRFRMPSRNLILAVMISEKEVMGTVCQKDQVDVEAKVESGLLR